MRQHPALKQLENRINLRTVPFTERGSRLLLFRDDDGLWLGQAEYETPVRDTIVFSNLHWTDAAGRRLEPLLTSRPDYLRFETEVGTFRLTFADPETLLLSLPTGRFGLCFATPFALNTDARGGTGTQSELRLSYTTDAELLRNEVAGQRVRLELNADASSVLILNLTRATPERSLPDAEAVLEAAQTRWSRWFGAVPEVLDKLKEQYYFAWWVLGVNLLRLRRAPEYEGLIPSKLGYVGVWHWDAYFHALGLRHADLDLAQDQFRLLLELYGSQSPDVHPSDMETIRQPLDYLGVNFYRRSVIADGPEFFPVHIRRVKPEGSEYTAMDWEVSPRGLYDILNYVHEGYDAPPLFVTENGAAFEDTVTAAGCVHDPERTAYLAAHFAEAARAVRDGIALKGYFVWTLLDNFEWAEGYSKRFGVIYTDYATQARIVKDSGRYLAQIAASQTVTSPDLSSEVNVA